MKIGLLASEIKQRANTDDLFEAIKKYGFESTQLSFSAIPELNFQSTGQIEFPERIDDKIISVIGAGAKRHGVEISVCSGTFNMAHPDREVREEGIKRLEALAHTAKKLNTKFISLCAGTRCRESLWVYHPENSTPGAWADMMVTMKKCVEIAERHDIILAVETEAATVVDTPEKARRMMDEIGSGNLKMIMDCANLFHSGEAKKENVQRTIARAFEIFGDDVVIAHGKDIANSDGIRFCPTGEGIVDYRQFIELLKKHNYKGDMLLHGIYDESKLPYARKTIQKAMIDGE